MLSFKQWAALSMLFLGTIFFQVGPLAAAEKTILFSMQDDFEEGAKNWQPTDEKAWKITKTDAGNIYNQFKKKSNYKPPHRSPYNISLLKDVVLGDFELNVKVKSTYPDYGHRDSCLFFGYQD